MNKRLVPAFLLTFVNVIGFSILMPVLPFVVESYDAPKWVYGLLITFYSAFQFLGAPYLGALSDRKGRKPILLISQGGTLLSWFVFLFAAYLPDIKIYGLAFPLIVIGVSRILDGVTGGNSSVANAYVSDITTREEKSYIFGYLGGIAGVAVIIGPAIGGLTASSSLGYAGTMLAAIAFSTVTLLTIFLWLKESHPVEKRSHKKQQSLFEGFLVLRKIRNVQASSFVNLIFLMKFIFSVMMAFYIATIALFLIDLFHFNEKELGYFMLFVGVFLSFNQAFVSKKVISKIGEFPTLIVGLVLSSIGMVSLLFTQDMWLYIGFYYILNLGVSLVFPTFNALLSIHADPEKQGEVMGISESINSLCMAVFPFVAAYLYGIWHYNIYYFIALIPLTALIIGIVGIKRCGISWVKS